MTATSGALILLVEDDSLLRGAFRLLLEDAGYRVHEAATAAEALDATNGEHPALILLDLGLPDRPGLDVARILRQRTDTATIPIMALTGHAGDADRTACIGAGCTAYVAKPIEPRHLLRKIIDLLDSV